MNNANRFTNGQTGDDLRRTRLNQVLAGITTVRCRTETADKAAEATYKDTPPMLEGIKVDGRWAVIYSRYDIGCAQEKNKSSACKGYDPDSALKLATAALLYSLKR